MTDFTSNPDSWKDMDGIPEDLDPDELTPEEEEKWMEFYNSIEGMNDETPDGRMPIESREFLSSIWDGVLQFMENQNREFSEGNIMLNFPQFKRFRDAFLFVKELEKAGIASNVRCEYRERSKQPSDVMFHADCLDFKGKVKDWFADIVEGACVISADGKLTGGLDFTLRFSKIWIPVPETH